MMNKIKKFIEKYNMITTGDRIIAGISGGADSICLLFVLLKLREESGIEFAAVHVNHGLRGESAKRDEEFVEGLCRQHHIICMTFHENVELISRKRKQSVEEAGRDVRKAAFEKGLQEFQGNKIALAHHQNDNAETILMNLARGTGLRGLGGIRPVNGNIIRPLLCLNRNEIEKFLSEGTISYCQDETNAKDEYTRNRIRHFVIPVLEEQVNSQTVKHMYETAGMMWELQEYVDSQVDEAFEECVDCQKDGSLLIRNSAFEKLSLFIQKSLLYRCIALTAREGKNLSAVHVEAVLELFLKQTGRSRSLPYAICARREYGGVVLAKEAAAARGFEARELQIPGMTEIPEYHLAICCEIFTKASDFSVKHIPENTYTKWFDYDIIKSSLDIRTRRAGDLVVIDKSGNRQKLKSYFVNEKVPGEVRDQVPVIAEGEKILWIVGYRMSSAYQVGDKTSTILQIKVMEEKEYVGEYQNFDF